LLQENTQPKVKAIASTANPASAITPAETLNAVPKTVEKTLDAKPEVKP
jgi:hypothetical protein